MIFGPEHVTWEYNPFSGTWSIYVEHDGKTLLIARGLTLPTRRT